MRATGKISFLEPNVVEHSLNDGYVLRLSTVRGARHGELLITPAESVETARAEKRNYLERLGAGSPVSEGVGVAGCAEELVIVADHRGVHTVL